MSILWVRDRGKSLDQTETGQLHFTSHYKAKSDSPTETRIAVLASELVPHWGAANAEYPLAFCVKVISERDKENPYLWDVTAEWNTSTASGNDPTDDQLQPDQRRPKWSAQFVPFPVARFHDLDGKLLADAAGTPFDPPPDIPIYVDEITIVRYEATIDRPAQRFFMGAANKDTWLGAGEGEALIDNIAVSEEFIQGAYWFSTSYRVLVKPRIQVKLPKGSMQEVGGWNPEYVLNAGPMQQVQDPVTTERTKKPIQHDGFYDGRPAFLGFNGSEIAIDKDTGELLADPTFLEFRTKQTAEFAWLGLTPPSGWTGV